MDKKEKIEKEIRFYFSANKFDSLKNKLKNIKFLFYFFNLSANKPKQKISIDAKMLNTDAIPINWFFQIKYTAKFIKKPKNTKRLINKNNFIGL